MTEVLLIAGPSGSGKSYLQNLLKSKGYDAVISSTTRDIRVEEGEVDGIHYNFKKDESHFFEDDYVEHAQVGDKFYGTPTKEFLKSEKIAHVIEPYGIKQILDKFKDNKEINIKVIYMDIDRETCKKNLMGEKGYLTEKQQKRFDRDIKDSIPERLKEMDIKPNLVIPKLDYDIDEVLKKLQ